MASHSVVEAFSTLGELDIAIGKARIGEAVSICTDIAHQVHGAMGYTLEHSLNHRTRRLWSWREEYGNEREWQKIVGRHFCCPRGRQTLGFHDGFVGSPLLSPLRGPGPEILTDRP